MFTIEKENHDIENIIDTSYSFYSSVELTNRHLFDNAYDLYLSGANNPSSYEEFRQYILTCLKDIDDIDKRTLLNDLESSSKQGLSRNETKKVSFTFSIIGVIILAAIVILDFIVITKPSSDSGIALYSIIDSASTIEPGQILNNIFFGIFILFSIYCVITIYTELKADTRELNMQSDAILRKHEFYNAISEIIRNTLD
ncbi:MAG: hypothetical protein ACK5LY_10765 [Lachnospirales bacterium]